MVNNPFSPCDPVACKRDSCENCSYRKMLDENDKLRTLLKEMLELRKMAYIGHVCIWGSEYEEWEKKVKGVLDD